MILSGPLSGGSDRVRGESGMYNKKNELYYHTMMLPGMVFIIIFSIIPMFGVVIAFQNFLPAKGIWNSSFVGFKNFQRMIQLNNFWLVVQNTLALSLSKIALGIVVPVFFAVTLNECHVRWYKKIVQSVTYLPHFLSWVILSVVFSNFFSLNGMFNLVLRLFDVEAQIWLIKPVAFRYILIFTDVWKNFGYSAIIYLAAITNINTELYEAAEIDGAGRLQRIRYVTVPGIVPTIILMSTLKLQGIFSAGFDQVFNMYNPLVYSTGDIIDTYIYRTGLVNMQYGLSSAVALVRSFISFVLIVASYRMAYKYAGYTIF